MKKTIKLIIIFAFILSAALLLVACNGNKHSLTYHAKVEPTCVDDGVKEYYSCSDCNKNFADKSASKELNSLTIAKLGHNLTFKPEVKATCSENGNFKHYECDRCNKNFADENATNELTNVIENKLPHDLVFVEKVNATCIINGIKAHFKCKVCTKFYIDEDATVEIDDIVITASHFGGTEIKGQIIPTIDREGYTGDTYCLTCKGLIQSGATIDKLTHIHNMQKTNKKEQTCTQNGNIEYYTCSICTKHYKDIDGVWEVKSSELIILAKHKLTFNQKISATCKKEGVKAHYKCSSCNKTYLDEDGNLQITNLKIEKSPHTPISEKIINNGNVCLYGGTLITTCNVCREQISNEVIKAGHTSSYWLKEVEPTLTSTGKLTAALCEECGVRNVEYILPCFNEIDYTKVVTDARNGCADEETAKYTYRIGTQSFEYNYTSPGGMHIIGYDKAGNPIYHDKNVYEYDANLFTKLADVALTCNGESFDVIFSCKGCNLPVGTKAQLTTHKFKYTVVSANTDGTVNILGTCKYGCGTTTEQINSAKATYKKEDSTCTAEGKEIWSITAINGETLETPLVAENTIAKKLHKLGTESIDTTKTLDWAIYKDKGVTKLADAVETCAAGGFSAVFNCSECKQPVGVTAAVLHVPINTSTKPVLTCQDADTTWTYTCAICDDTNCQELIEAPEHTYKYDKTSLVMPSENGTGTIRVYCQDCNETIITALIVKPLSQFSSSEKYVFAGNSQVGGYVTYTYTHELYGSFTFTIYD